MGLVRSVVSFLVIVLVAACSSTPSSSGAADGASFDAGHVAQPIHVPGPCDIVIDTPPLLPAAHVILNTPVTYSSNPPSSGPHYPVWAAYRAYTTPIDRRYYVHDLEHGAIVFVYKCADANGCPDVVRGLQAAADAIPDDPLCSAPVRVRTVITPDPLLDVPIAAAAWGWTYKAQCLDAPSLAGFARAHYAQGPENLCGDGMPF